MCPSGWPGPSSSRSAQRPRPIRSLCAPCRSEPFDPTRRFTGGDYYETTRRPVDGLSIARGIGHFSYRTGAEFEQRFGREPQGEEDPLKGGRYAIESYLQYHGEKLAKRFDPNSYVTLSEAMNHHDVGRGRGGIEPALGAVRPT